MADEPTDLTGPERAEALGDAQRLDQSLTVDLVQDSASTPAATSEICDIGIWRIGI